MKTETEYAKFEEKVKRTVYLDNLSPLVTDAVIKNAFEQYGNVLSIHFIPNFKQPLYNSKFALVELEKEKQAEVILNMLASYPFMMSGMPRPVRGRPAEATMFEDYPGKPGRKVQLSWLDPKDPDFETAQKLKNLVRKQASEQSFLLKMQLEEEEKLSKQQEETLKAQYQKYEMIDNITHDGTTVRLGKHYGIKMTEDNGS